MTSTTPTAADLFQEGALLAQRWRIEAALGGAMGTVLILRDPASGERVAAKTPRLDRVMDADARRRFELEARTWLSLGHHENVVEASFLEQIEVDGVGRPFLFLEYVDGPTLAHAVALEGRLGVPVVLDVATGIAWGMAHAHGETRPGPRIIHRDLKPENVFLTRNRVAKVSDFGIARALDRPDDPAAVGAGAGTPHYCAPEQLKDARAAGVRSDVYSFGALLVDLLTGQPPFPAESLSQLVFRVLREPALAPGARVPGVPPDLDALILACLEKSPGDRPASFGEILRTLSAIRELDGLWVPDASARSCTGCGWLSVRPARTCSVCGSTTSQAERYAPVSARSEADTPTLGRTTAGRLTIEGVEVRPRRPCVGDEIAITTLISNPGGEAVESVLVPHSVPDRDAFTRSHAHTRAFRGTVAPTAEGAPLRISWTVRALREGTFAMPEVRASYRGPDGRRITASGAGASIEVAPRETLPLGGRQAEWAALTQCLDAAAAGGASLALLRGAPGFGKSRLAREVRAEARLRGFQVARGRCLDRGAEVRGALKEGLRQILRLPESGANAPQVASALVDLLGAHARGEAALVEFLVAELLGLPLPRGESPGHMWARLTTVLSSDTPLLIVVEDVQRDVEVGRVALGMARAAAQAECSLFVVLTARPSLGDAIEGGALLERIDAARTELDCRHVLDLAAFEPDEVRAVVDASFDPNDFAESAPWLADAIATASGGVPVFVAEIVGTLRDAISDDGPLLQTIGGHWTAGPALSEQAVEDLVPAKVEQLVLSRLAGLSAPIRRFARVAGILGDVFEAELLRLVVDNDPLFAEGCERLERAGVFRETRGALRRIRFHEPLLPEILARDLATSDPDTYRSLNARAAELLSSLRDPNDKLALRLARHFEAAGRSADAFRARLRAAARLSSRQSYARAAAVLRRAEDLVPAARGGLTVADLRSYYTLRAESLRFSGDYPGALAAYGVLVDESSGLEPSVAELADALGRMGKVHESVGEYESAERRFTEGLRLRQSAGLHYDLPMSFANLGGLLLTRGDLERAAELTARAERAASVVGNARVLGRAQVLQAQLASRGGDSAAARRHVRDALRTARGCRDRTAVADAWNVLGHVATTEGKHDRALRLFLRALELRREIGNVAGLAASWNNVGLAREALGLRSEAVNAFERSIELHRRCGSRRGLVTTLINVARLEYESGRPRRALRRFEEARQHLGPDADEAVAVELRLEEARARVATTAPSSPEERVAEAELLEVASRIESLPNLAARATLTLAHVLLDRRERDAARKLVAPLLDTAGLSPDSRHRVLSALAILEGNVEMAEAALRLTEVGSPPRLRARALAAAGRAYVAEGRTAEAAERLRRAAGLIRQAGIVEPFALDVLHDLVGAARETDPATSEAAAKRSEELRDELERRGFAPERLASHRG